MAKDVEFSEPQRTTMYSVMLSGRFWFWCQET